MFILYADKNRLIVRKREPVTSGSVNVYPVQFEFSGDWDGLTRTAVFRAGAVTSSIMLDDPAKCTIPWEVLKQPNLSLYAGVCGIRDETIVLPTVWADLGKILEGVTVGDAARPPTPDVYQQLLDKYEKLVALLDDKGDRLLLDGVELQLLSGDDLLSTVILPTGGGEGGGVSDHRQLSGRDAADQHPIEAITGLKEAIPRAMTADELRKILMGGQ